jgi:hypothetical protein
MRVKNEKLNVDGEIKILDTTAPEGVTQDVSAMGMEAVVDPTPQPLRTIKPFVQAIKSVPTTIPPEAQIVLHALLACFEKQKNIKEGVIKDLIWGFSQSGIPDGCTALGLKQLDNLGYIKIQAPDMSIIDVSGAGFLDSWVKYQPKLLELVYE